MATGTHSQNAVTAESGFYVGTKESATQVIDSSGNLIQAGTQITSTADELNILDLSAVGAVSKVKRISIGFGDGTTENDTGWDLPEYCVVTNVIVQVTTAEATGGTKTIDVGTLSTDSGDADGFLDGVSVATKGLVKGTLASAGQTVGVLLRADEDGSGALVPEPCVAPGSRSVSWTPGSNDFAELAGYIYIFYTEIG